MSEFVGKYWQEIVLAFIVFSTAVDSMEEPVAADSKGYKFLYRFGHGLSFNLVTAFSKLPQLPKETK